MTALVNPVLEWASEERELGPEGCLSLPGVHVEVERASAVRVRARDGEGEEIIVEAEGLPARVIQHEIDHLDGVLILDRISRRSARRRCGRCARRRPPPAPASPAESCVDHGLPRHLRVRRRGPRADRAGPRHRPALVITRPDRPAGRGRRLLAPPVAERSQALGVALEQPQDVNAPEVLSLIAASGPPPATLIVCAFGAMIREPHALSASRSSTCIPRCCPAGGGRRRSSGRSWPVTARDRRLHHAADRRTRQRARVPERCRADTARGHLWQPRGQAAGARRGAALTRAAGASAVRGPG